VRWSTYCFVPLYQEVHRLLGFSRNTCPNNILIRIRTGWQNLSLPATRTQTLHSSPVYHSLSKYISYLVVTFQYREVNIYFVILQFVLREPSCPAFPYFSLFFFVFGFSVAFFCLCFYLSLSLSLDFRARAPVCVCILFRFVMYHNNYLFPSLWLFLFFCWNSCFFNFHFPLFRCFRVSLFP
jgi:hypothetical protein